MKAHIPEKDKALHKAMADTLRKVRQTGLINGAAGVAGVILDWVKNEELSEHDRLEKIKLFCEKSLGLKEKNDNAE